MPSIGQVWQLNRELGSSPQALSSMSSSVSEASFSSKKPSRTIIWQVVQAHDISQACSILMPSLKAASHIDSSALVSNSAPPGQSSE